MKPKVIIILVVVALFLIIFAQNTQTATVNVFFWTFATPQIILLSFTLLGGFIIGYLTSTVTRRKQRQK